MPQKKRFWWGFEEDDGISQGFSYWKRRFLSWKGGGGTGAAPLNLMIPLKKAGRRVREKKQASRGGNQVTSWGKGGGGDQNCQCFDLRKGKIADPQSSQGHLEKGGGNTETISAWLGDCKGGGKKGSFLGFFSAKGGGKVTI